MVRCDVQRWNMQKQIDATRYIVPYKMDDHYRIAVCASPDAHCITRSSYTVTSLRVTLWSHSTLHCDVTPRYAVTSLRVMLWSHSALRCDVTPRYAVTWLFTRHPAIRHIHVKNKLNCVYLCACMDVWHIFWGFYSTKDSYSDPWSYITSNYTVS